MTTNDALKALADHYGIEVSEPLKVIFKELYDNEDELLILPALPGNAKVISGKTGIAEQKISEELNRLAYKGAVFKMPSGEFVLPRILLELNAFLVLYIENSFRMLRNR